MRHRRSPSSIFHPSVDPVSAYLLDVGDQVRARRQRSGLTQAELAERAGVSKRALCYLEEGRNATLATCAKVALALGLQPEELSLPAGLVGGVARVVMERYGVERSSAVNVSS